MLNIRNTLNIRFSNVNNDKINKLFRGGTKVVGGGVAGGLGPGAGRESWIMGPGLQPDPDMCAIQITPL